MTSASVGTTQIRRLLQGATGAGLCWLLLGCAAAPGPLKSWGPFGGDANDRLLRKQVEADPFPSAQKVGLKAEP
jgi:hypothetical protein